MSLFISIATASADLTTSAINDAITLFAARLAKARAAGKVPVEPAVDVKFLLPGQLDKPAFSGMRMGGYTDRDRTLYFEASVPDHIVRSERAGDYVAQVMQDVVVNADQFFRENDLDFDRLKWQQFVNQLGTPEGVVYSMTQH